MTVIKLKAENRLGEPWFSSGLDMKECVMYLAIKRDNKRGVNSKMLKSSLKLINPAN